MTKNFLVSLKQLHTGLPIHFSPTNITGMLPISTNPAAGTVIFGAGLPTGGVSVVEPIESVQAKYNEWFASDLNATRVGQA